MKEIDDTPMPENESELTDDAIKIAFIQVNDRIRAIEGPALLALAELSIRIEALEQRIAELETQRVANENNQDDPEWF